MPVFARDAAKGEELRQRELDAAKKRRTKEVARRQRLASHDQTPAHDPSPPTPRIAQRTPCWPLEPRQINLVRGVEEPQRLIPEDRPCRIPAPDFEIS